MTSQRVAFVTGGTSGIGRAVVETFASRGVAVAFAGRNAERATAVREAVAKSGVPVLFVRTDVSNGREVEDAMTATLERFGRIDCAVNAAASLGAGGFKKTAEVTEAEYDAALAAAKAGALASPSRRLSNVRRGGSV